MRDSAVATLRRHMPLGVPTVSVVAALPFVVAAAVTVGLHLCRRHMLLSIAVGTAAHVALATSLAGL